MTHVDLFSGIGGFALACRHVGLKTICFCESDPFCHRILAKQWPDVPISDDVKQFNGNEWQRPTLLTAGFPCQDASIAQTRKERSGLDGERTGLWSELARVISEARPKFALMENVTNLLVGDGGDWFGRILRDLAEIGYDAEWHCIPASHVGAPHQRDRVWIVAHANSEGLERHGRDDKRAGEWFAGARFPEKVWDEFDTEILRVADGVPKRLDKRIERLRSLGNAVCVPLVVEILRAIFDHQPSVGQRSPNTLPD